MRDRENQVARLRADLAEAQRTITMLHWQLRLALAREQRRAAA